jgi:CDP-4-dehydro-6-deoxyglucose reductase, E3
MPPPPAFEARLESARLLTPSVRELVFERVDAEPMAFEAGQWVNVLLPIASGNGEATIKRSYSIASAPNGSPRFEIAVTRVERGPASTWLHSVSPGAVLPFTGPQGFFTRTLATAAPSLMIATGTGVTPLRSMMRSALAAGYRQPVWLLLGVRREHDLLYADELRAAVEASDFVRFEPTLSQPAQEWSGRRGYVQTHVRELWRALESLSPVPPHAYVCGLHRMVASVREVLRTELGAAREQVHSERYD